MDCPWVQPEDTGHRIPDAQLHTFPTANDGPAGITIDQAFINANAGAPWLSTQGGLPVISGARIFYGLNVEIPAIIRDNWITVNTRFQTPSWGFFSNDAPVVNINFAADGSLVEYNTLEGTGVDDTIVASGVRSAGEDTIVQYNDISGTRGGCHGFRRNTCRYNYFHDYAFGWQSNRQGGTQLGLPDEVTHNNGINNTGYDSWHVYGNYFDLRYGIVSQLQPGDPRYPFRLTPIFRNTVYNTTGTPGEVAIGDPIDGFTFAQFLINEGGADYQVYDNYVAHAGRALRVQGTPGVGPTDFSRNVFVSDRFDDFQGVDDAFQDTIGPTSGSCNQRELTILPNNIFEGGVHGTSGCTIVDPIACAALADEPVELADDAYGGQVGQPFSTDPLFNDPNLGDQPTTCTIIGGSLPPGITFNGSILTGTPTAAGVFAAQYQCTDADGDSDIATIQFFIEDAPVTGGGQLRCILT